MHWRLLRTGDLAECLALDPGSLGDELIGREAALDAWRILSRSAAFIGALVEADRAIAGSRIMGFGCTAFVTEDFALRELADPRPGLNARILASLTTGAPVTLDCDQIAQGNRSGGLYAAVLASVLRESDLSQEELDHAMAGLFSAALHCHTGYRLRMMLREAVGAVNIRHVEWQQVFRCVSRSGDRALFMLDATGARSVFGGFYHRLFQCQEPVLNLSRVEQDLLNSALAGFTDEELARELSLKLATVKKRWASTLSRVAAAKPNLLPEPANGPDTRGRQRRHHLLAYLREHPEELRPWALQESSRQRTRHQEASTYPRVKPAGNVT